MKRLIQIGALFIFVGVVLVLGDIPVKEVKIIPAVVSPVNNQTIHESDDVVFRLFKGMYVPVKFENAYQAMLDKNRIQIKAELKAESMRAKK